MSMDVDFDVDGINAYNGYFGNFQKEEMEVRDLSSIIHRSISNDQNSLGVDLQARVLFLNGPSLFGSETLLAKVDKSGEVRAGITWGGDDGVQGFAEFTGKVKDEEGNYFEIDIKQSSDGKGEASVAGGTPEKQN